MDSSTTPSTSPRPGTDGGRVAVPEVAELLYLQRPAAAVAAAAVVLLGLLGSLVLPDLLPANMITGLVVGVLALLAAVAAAVVLDGRDPVLRGPRHVRRDGHTVLARMAGPDPVEHGGTVLAALERRLDGRDHLGVVLTGTGTDPSELAVVLGRGAAADGHTALVIDLRAGSSPGVAEVGEGRVRLGEAAQLAEDRPYAWIGAGADRDAAVTAATTVANRPPRDLQLLLIVAPEAATHVPDLLDACDRTLLLVAADSAQRSMVTARVESLERAGANAEIVVVGGVRLEDGERTPIAPLGLTSDTGPEPVPGRAASAGAAGAGGAASAAAAPGAAVPASTSVRVVSPSPAPEPEAAAEAEPEGDLEPEFADEDEFAHAAEDEPEAADEAAFAPETAEDSAFAPETAEDSAGEPEAADDGPEPEDDAAPSVDPFARPEPGPDSEPRPAPATDPEPTVAFDPITDAEPAEDPTPPRSDPPTAPHAALEDTGPIPPVVFRTGTPAGETRVEGMADPDPLSTIAALDHLSSRHQEWPGQD